MTLKKIYVFFGALVFLAILATAVSPITVAAGVKSKIKAKNLDIQAPVSQSSIQITATKFWLRFSATDNVRVVRIQLASGTTVLSSKDNGPAPIYSSSLSASYIGNIGTNELYKPNTHYTLNIKAYDAAGNIGTSTITFNTGDITPTPPPPTYHNFTTGQFVTLKRDIVDTSNGGHNVVVPAGTSVKIMGPLVHVNEWPIHIDGIALGYDLEDAVDQFILQSCANNSGEMTVVCEGPDAYDLNTVSELIGGVRYPTVNDADLQ